MARLPLALDRRGSFSNRRQNSLGKDDIAMEAHRGTQAVAARTVVKRLRNGSHDDAVLPDCPRNFEKGAYLAIDAARYGKRLWR